MKRYRIYSDKFYEKLEKDSNELRQTLEAQRQKDLEMLRATWEKKINDVKAKIDARNRAKEEAERFLQQENEKREKQVSKIKSEIKKIKESLSGCGIKSGDIVIVHSSFDGLKNLGLSAEKIIDLIFEVFPIIS